MEVVVSNETNERMAQCAYKDCKSRLNGSNRYPSSGYGYIPEGKRRSVAPSSEREDLPFFREHPEEEFDEFYCGCFGWD